MAYRKNILVVESSPIIRCGIITMLQRASIPHIAITETTDLAQRTTWRGVERPDIVIVNPSQIGGLNPSQIRAEIGGDDLKIVALQSTHIDPSSLLSYDAVISIYDTIDTLRKCIETLTEVSDEVSDKRELSAREKEVVVCVVKGLTNKQIADSLSLSTHTVIAHRRNISNKLQIFSPSGLTIYAIVNKLVDLSDIKNSITQNRDEE